MIVKQAEGDELRVRMKQSVEPIQKSTPVRIIEKDRLSLIPAIEDMIPLVCFE